MKNLSKSSALIISELKSLAHEALEVGILDMQDNKVRYLHDKILMCLDSASHSDAISIMQSDEVQELRSTLIRLNADLHKTTEIALAQRFLSEDDSGDPFVDSWINKGFTNLLNSQIDQWQDASILDDVKKGPIVVVGGGALPQTQVFLHRSLGCEVISVDIDEQSATLCTEVLRKMGLTHTSVICADAKSFNFERASIVVVATLVRQKAEIAAQVAKTAPDAYFAPRTPVKLHAMWRELVCVEELSAKGWQSISVLTPPESSVASMLFSYSATREPPI
ncbi:hypothetical protein PS720_01381 [Pseudomonas fluorescens]|nr:hypothetical protein PS720_01381 [Pseudomonas fluorescens]